MIQSASLFLGQIPQFADPRSDGTSKASSTMVHYESLVNILSNVVNIMTQGEKMQKM